VQLSWTHEYWGAGFYLAEQDGHFAEQNLDVNLIPGGFGPNGYIEPIDEVLNGNGDFGLGSVSSLLKAREEGKPVVAVATLLQRSPFALISLSDQGIEQPQDLVGKTVTVADGGRRWSTTPCWPAGH
jgi:ABC-type nitrate/sulfonate/bicarbonate transport system substrate-binding protein